MKTCLLSIVVSLLFVSGLIAQNDSVATDDIYRIDTVIIADTILVTDTIITYDTTLIKVSGVERDTLFLSSDAESWSLIPQDTVSEDVFVRRDSGLWLLTAKIGFSDQSSITDWTGYSINSIPPLAMQAEYFHNDFFSYGGQLLYSRNKYTNDTLTTTYFKNTVFGLAAIGTFHYGSWLQDVTHNWFKFGYLDLYVSMALRMDVHRNIAGGAWDEALMAFDASLEEKEIETMWRIRPIFGARYYITDRFSLNVEVGKGNLGMLSSSVSWLISNP